MDEDGFFYLNGSQGKLYCQAKFPMDKERFPAVILSHGFGGNLDFPLWEPLIATFNDHGIGAVRFDFNGCGKSDGKFVDMTVPNEIMDLMAVITWTLQNGRVTSVSLIGHSQGGVVSGMAAGECGASQIASLGLLSAAAVLRDDALRGSSQGAEYDPWNLDKPAYEVPGRGLAIGRAYIQTAMSLPIYATTAKYTGPTLVINGMADQVVPYTYAQRYKHVLKNAELVLMPGENHVYSVNMPYVARLVSDWFIKRLAGE